MNGPLSDQTFTRRRALGLAGAAAAGAALTRLPAIADGATPSAYAAPAVPTSPSALPKDRLEAILRTDGTWSNGLLQFEYERDDLHVTGPHGIPFKPAFEVNGTFFFQSLGHGRAIMNGDTALLSHELNPFIDALLAHGLVFQAEHQHYFDLDPMVWFIHTRAVGDPIDIARGIHAAIATSATPLPQHSPAHPTTPLDAKRIGEIIGGDATVGAEGTVTVDVPRRERLVLDGVCINPFLNVMTGISFEPLPGGGSQHAACAPDFGMIASEVDAVCRRMRANGFEIHCLYNQETAEQPQLYFSHHIATGDALELARKVRQGLDLMNVELH
ncbi:MAG TPA: DUF1259 domain-containing protein [Acidimicrobiia bacterium]|nr:DUF1259 domain-containing protein [Acidimicrobiia bacterium]